MVSASVTGSLSDSPASTTSPGPAAIVNSSGDTSADRRALRRISLNVTEYGCFNSAPLASNSWIRKSRASITVRAWYRSNIPDVDPGVTGGMSTTYCFPAAVSRVETFGLAANVDWQAHDIEPAAGVTKFHVRRRGSPFGTFEVPLVGEYNVRNSLAAMAVGVDAGLSAAQIREGLKSFAGVKRRLEVVGTAGGVTIYDDFAHHPTAVGETLVGVRAAHPTARIWAVFEPRSASSCRRVFQDDFARAFAAADEVLIAPVFRSKLPESDRLSVPRLVRDLADRGQSAREADSIDDIIAAIVEEHRPGDRVVIMSNGGFGGIHQKLLRALA